MTETHRHAVISISQPTHKVFAKLWECSCLYIGLSASKNLYIKAD